LSPFFFSFSPSSSSCFLSLSQDAISCEKCIQHPWGEGDIYFRLSASPRMDILENFIRVQHSRGVETKGVLHIHTLLECTVYTLFEFRVHCVRVQYVLRFRVHTVLRGFFGCEDSARFMLDFTIEKIRRSCMYVNVRTTVVFAWDYAHINRKEEECTYVDLYLLSIVSFLLCFYIFIKLFFFPLSLSLSFPL
jgi:hypothetical protein